MSFNVLKEINWLDILILVLFVRICYVALKTGFPIELFKFLGTISAVYFSLHYYIALSELVIKYVPIKDIPLQIVHFAIFLVLASSGYLIFTTLRNAIYNIIKLEAVSNLNKWGGLVLGSGRAILFISLLIFIMKLSNIEYLDNSVTRSYTAKAMANIAPDTYSWIWNNIISKFATAEKHNNAVSVKQEESKK